jgi:hypothetical protein
MCNADMSLWCEWSFVQKLQQLLNATLAIKDTECLLQDSDLGRLKAVIYRDMVWSKNDDALWKC